MAVDAYLELSPDSDIRISGSTPDARLLANGLDNCLLQVATVANQS
jgi:hypothetical protein